MKYNKKDFYVTLLINQLILSLCDVLLSFFDACLFECNDKNQYSSHKFIPGLFIEYKKETASIFAKGKVFHFNSRFSNNVDDDSVSS